MEEQKKTRKSLSQRITVQLAVLMALMAVLVTSISYLALRATYLNLYSEKAQDLARSLAAEVDGDKVENYVITGETDEYYDWLKSEFDRVKSKFTGIQYVYLAYPEQDRFIYVVEGFAEGDDMSQICSLGDVYEYEATEYEHLLPDIEAGRASTELILGQDVGYGASVSAWAPVFDSSGRVVGIVEADCSLSNLNAVVRAHALRIVGVLLLCIFAVLALDILILRRNVSEPVGQLTSLVNSYANQAIAEPKLRYDDELQWLAGSFAEMTRRIDAYTAEVERVTAEKERIGAELNVATKIQADMLPRIFPPFPDRKELDLYASMTPAKEVGGDFYDFFLIDDDHLAMVIADVSGKGVPAALFMVIAKTLIKNRAQMGGTPAGILHDVNEQLSEGNEAELFVTVWLAILELSTGKGMAANAGHEHPAVRRGDGTFELVKYRHSPALATMGGMKFREHEFTLAPGDCLFVYTDGVTEATNADKKLFGEEKLTEALNRDPAAKPKELLQSVKQAIDEFVGDAVQFDDITMLCLHYAGPEESV